MRLLLLCLTFALAFFSVARPASAVRIFSVDVSSSARADDVLSAGPIGGPPTVEIAGNSDLLRFPGAAGEEIDALTTCGPVTGALEISVDRLAAGLPATQLAGESAAGQAAADIFIVDLSEGVHWFGRSQHLLGLLPAVAPGVPYSPPPVIDDLDALDILEASSMDHPMPCLLFSVPTSNGLVGATGADILVYAGPPPALVKIALGYAPMGLAAADDIDALHVDLSSQDVYFSLAPGSPTLAGANAICGDPCSAADVFRSAGATATASRVYSAGHLGLSEGDNLDAMGFVPAVAVPSLSRGALSLTALLLGMSGVLGRTGLRRVSGARQHDGVR